MDSYRGVNMQQKENADQVNKLTDWVNEPTIDDLKQNITDAESDQDAHIINVNKWLDNMNLTGSASVPKRAGQSAVAPKLIRKQAEWRYSSLSEPFLSSPDIFDVRPITAGDRKRAKQNELILNNQFNTKINKIQFIDSYVREAVDIGTVLVRVGWDTEEEEVTETVPLYEFIPDTSGELAQKYDFLLEMMQQDNEQYMDYSTPGLDAALQIYAKSGQAYFAKQVGEEEQTTIKETKNQPTVEIMNSENIIIDPSCNGDLSLAEFIGERFKSSLAALARDGKYTNLEKVNVDGESPLTSPDYEENSDISGFAFSDKARKQFVVHTYWGSWDINKDGTTQQIVVSWVGDTIIRMELNPFPDKRPPFVKAVYMPVRRSIFGEPDGALLEDNQKIIGAVTRGMIDLLAKSANGQTGLRKDLLDITNQRKFKRGEDYEFNGSADPRQAIHSHVYPEIPQSAYNMLQIQNADAESLTGVKAFSSGITGQAISGTATGVRGVLDAASKRELDILRRLAQGIIEIGRKIIAMNAVFLSEEETVRITNNEFVQVRRDDLAGSFDLYLTISTAEEDSKKAEELAYMLQTMGPNQDPGITKMLQADIARLRKMPDLAKRIEEYQPQPDPLAVRKAELEIIHLEAQIAKENALAAKHSAEAGLSDARSGKESSQGILNMAKSNTEQALARNLGSDSDQKDLDYVKKAKGIDHQQKLQEIETKGRQDAAVKVVDNSTKQQEKEAPIE